MSKLSISGACGRMGQRLALLSREIDDLTLVQALEHPDHPQLGQDYGLFLGTGSSDILVSAEPDQIPDVMIDFSSPQATLLRAEYCRRNHVPLVIGTTGLDDDQLRRLHECARDIPILIGANMSLGMNLLFKLVEQVAAALSDDYDIEIVETHHRFKKDAPSGTALKLAQQIASAKKWPFPSCLTHGRQGTDALRQPHTIGMHAVRGGDTVGEHSVFFAALGETLELKHAASTRDNFARGALHAAVWLTSQKPGSWTMFDMLGL